MHSGWMVRGNVGAGSHFEYRVVGDVVITATRIEGLNKHLGTRVLASEDVLDQLDDFLTRKVGKFLLVGKLEPVKICEVLAIRDDAKEEQISLCSVFAEGLTAFQKGNWEQAIKRLNECIRINENDGPSLFYMKLCETHIQNPPPDDWGGVVRMYAK
jgi:adenylate cyclase